MTVSLKRKIMSTLFWTRFISLIQFSMTLPLQPLMTRRVENFEAEKPFIFNWLKFQSISYLNMTTEIRELYNMSVNRSITYHNEANGKTVLKPTAVPFSTKQPLSFWSDSIPELNLPDSQIYMSASEKFVNKVPHNDHSDKENKYIIEENDKKGAMEYLKWPNPPKEMNFSAGNFNSNNTNSTQSEHSMQKKISKKTEANPVFIKTTTILPWMVVYENNGQINSKNLESVQPKTSIGSLVKIISSTVEPEEINVDNNVVEKEQYDKSDKVQSPSEIKETRVRMDDRYLVSQQVDENLKNYNGNILSSIKIAQKDEKINYQNNKPKSTLDVLFDDDDDKNTFIKPYNKTLIRTEVENKNPIVSSTSILKSSIETDWGNEEIINESENKEEAIRGNELMSSNEEKTFGFEALTENYQTKELTSTIDESIQDKSSDQDTTSNVDKYNQAASENKEIKIQFEQTTSKLSETTFHFTNSDQHSSSTISPLGYDNSITSTEHVTTCTNDNDEVKSAVTVQIDTNAFSSSDSFSTTFSENSLTHIGNSNDEYLDLNKKNWEIEDNDELMGASENQEIKIKVEETTKTDNLDSTVTRTFGRKETNSKIESNEMNSSSEKIETFSPQFTTEIINNWSNEKKDASENQKTTVKFNDMTIHVTNNPDHLSSIAIRNLKKDDPLTSTMTIEGRLKIENDDGKATTVEINTEKLNVLVSNLEKESSQEITTNETPKTTKLKTYVTDNLDNSKKENFDTSNTMKTYDKKYSTETKIPENIWESTTEGEKNNNEMNEVMSASENKMITITADEMTNTHTQSEGTTKSNIYTAHITTDNNERGFTNYENHKDYNNTITNDDENDDVLNSSLQEETIQFFDLDEMDLSMGASEIEGIKIKAEEAGYFTNPGQRSVTISNLVHDDSITSTEYMKTFNNDENKGTTRVNIDEIESHEKVKSHEDLDNIFLFSAVAENDENLNNSYKRDESMRPHINERRTQVQSTTQKQFEANSNFNDSDQRSFTTISSLVHDNSMTSTEHTTTFKNNENKAKKIVNIDEKESHEKVKSHEDLDNPFPFSGVAENDDNLNNSHEWDESMGASEIKEIKVQVEQTTQKLSETISHFKFDDPDQRSSISITDFKKDDSITTEDATNIINDDDDATKKLNIDSKGSDEAIKSDDNLGYRFPLFPFSKSGKNGENLDNSHERDESMGASEIKEIKVQVEQTTQKISEAISHFADDPDQRTSIAIRDFKKDHSITTEYTTNIISDDDDATKNVGSKESDEANKNHDNFGYLFPLFPFSESDKNDENLDNSHERDESMGASEIKEIKVQVEQTTQKLSETISHFKSDDPDQRSSISIRDFKKDDSITTEDATNIISDDDDATKNVGSKGSDEAIKNRDNFGNLFPLFPFSESDKNNENLDNNHERDESMGASEIKEIKVQIEQTTQKLSETISHFKSDDPDQRSSISIRAFIKDDSITTEDATNIISDDDDATKNVGSKQSDEANKNHDNFGYLFPLFPFSESDKNDENLDNSHERDESMGASEIKEIKVQVEQTTQKISEAISHFTDDSDQRTSIAIRDFKKDHSITTEYTTNIISDDDDATKNVGSKESDEANKNHDNFGYLFPLFPFSESDKNDENLDNSHERDESMGASEIKEIKVQVEQTTQKLSETISHFKSDDPDQRSSISIRDFKKDDSITTEDATNIISDDDDATKNVGSKGSDEAIKNRDNFGHLFPLFPFSESDKNDENLDNSHERDESMGASEIKEIKVQVEQPTQKLSETISHFTDHPDQRSSIANKDFKKDHSITTEDATTFKSNGDKATTVKIDIEASHQIFESHEDYDGHIPISTEEENDENMDKSYERDISMNGSENKEVPMQFEKTTQKLRVTTSYFTDHPDPSSITINDFRLDDSITSTEQTPTKEINFNDGTTAKIQVKESFENFDRDDILTSILDSDSSNTVNNDDLINLDDNYDMGASEILETKIKPETSIKEGELIKNVSGHASTHHIKNEQLSGEHSNKTTDLKSFKNDDSGSIKDIDLWKVIINYDDNKGPIFKEVVPQRKSHDENESYELKSIHKTLELEFLNQSLKSKNGQNISASNSSNILNITKDNNLENEDDKNIPVTFTTTFKTKPLEKGSKELIKSPYEDGDQESSEEENVTQFNIVSTTNKPKKINHEKIKTKPAVFEPITYEYQFNTNRQNKYEKVNQKDEFTTNGYERSFTFYVPRQKTFDFGLPKNKQEFNH